MGKNIGRLTSTPWHIENLKLKEGESKRNKHRCVYFNDGNCYMPKSRYFKIKCMGSSHCTLYSEVLKEDNEQNILETQPTFNKAKFKKGKCLFYKGNKNFSCYLNKNITCRLLYFDMCKNFRDRDLYNNNKKCVYNYGKNKQGCRVKAHPICDWLKICDDFVLKEIGVNENPKNLILNKIVTKKAK